MLTDAELITLKNALEILVQYQIRESQSMKNINDESLRYHQKKLMIRKASDAEGNLARFVYQFPER